MHRILIEPISYTNNLQWQIIPLQPYIIKLTFSDLLSTCTKSADNAVQDGETMLFCYMTLCYKSRILRIECATTVGYLNHIGCISALNENKDIPGTKAFIV